MKNDGIKSFLALLLSAVTFTAMAITFALEMHILLKALLLGIFATILILLYRSDKHRKAEWRLKSFSEQVASYPVHPFAADRPPVVMNMTYIFLHFVLANILAWLAMGIPDYNETIQPLVNMVASVIPSVKGMGEMSPNRYWGELYFLLCLAASPLYIRFWWKVMAFAPPVWFNARPIKFWLHVVGALVFTFGFLLIMKPLNLSYTSVRSADFVSGLMQESYLIYGIVALVMVITFSLMLGASAKAIQLRIANHRETK